MTHKLCLLQRSLLQRSLLLTCISASLTSASLFSMYTQSIPMDNKEFIFKLYDIGAIQFGSFTLKSGLQSDHYIDLRRLISFPDLLSQAADFYWQMIKECKYDYICGVPYAALPFATTIAIQHNIPMIMPRKEVKDYGTKRAIEGVFQPGKTCLVIEDLFTTGSSTLHIINTLEQAGLIVKDVAILINREQGGVEHVISKGYHVHAAFTWSEIHEVLYNTAVINRESVHARTSGQQ